MNAHFAPAFATRRPRPLGRGFSLLEALIAVVVLSTGLLALTALQSAMIRSSVDARIRSSAAAAAVAVVENLRSMGYQAIPTGANIAVDPAALPFLVVDSALGAGGITIRYDAQTWMDDGGVFGTTVPVQPPLAEFKQVDVTVSWTDPFGNGVKSVQFSDIVGPLGANISTVDVSTLGSTLNAGRPIVRTVTPEGPGVIPIAVGNNEDTAATNPKPVIVGKGNKDTIIETRFDVLNFSDAGDAFGDDIVQIQKRVETSITACRCTLGASSGASGTIAGTSFRPTFWDGTRYAPPKQAQAGGGAPSNNADVQSELCVECCRDHHDPAGVQGPTFDPFRAAANIPHAHFLAVDTVTPLNSTPVSGGGDYFEVCRLIRVDGLWRVAADFDSRFFGLLETSEKSVPADDPVPDQDAADVYEEFVLDVLRDEFVATVPTVNRSTDLAPRYASAGLDAPTSLSINRPRAGTANDFRFLHARGFYIDHLEPDAVARIDKARTDCPSGTPLESCVLPFVPFTTINVTELAKWSPSSPVAIQVTNASGILFGDPSNPVRGQVNALAQGPGNGDAVTVNGRSNSGLAATNLVTDPQDALEAQSDRQRFDITSGGVDPQGERFNVTLNGLPQTADSNTSNDPAVAWLIGLSGNNCAGTFSNNGDNNPNPYSCSTTSVLNRDVTVIVGQYNRIVTGTATVTCSTAAGSVTASRTDVPFCQNYRVSSATAGGGSVAGTIGTILNSGSLNEATPVSFPTVAPNDSVVFGFQLEGTTQGSVAACTLSPNGKQIRSITYTDPCS
ncbi:MAG TPA: hypothetical protein DDZ76_08915 [Xanthomonadales bacterium]|nr:hypothetical protein [Xanthomonadales bacterium]